MLQLLTKRKAAKAVVWAATKAVAWSLLTFFFLQALVVDAYRIESTSMQPTLHPDDWVFVNKILYRPKIPLTNYRLLSLHRIRRGEVLAINLSGRTNVALGQEFVVKRVVGLPFDTLTMRKGLLLVNGVLQLEPYAPRAMESLSENAPGRAFSWLRAASLSGSRHGSPPSFITNDDWGPVVVPRGHYFVLGDNRHASTDSRAWGFVSEVTLLGRVILIYYSETPRSRNQAGTVRWGRMGRIVR